MVIHDDMATPAASSVATSGGGKSQASLSSQRLICKICGANFVYPGSFTKHMQRHEMSNKRNQESSSSPILPTFSTPPTSMVASSPKGLQQVAPKPVSQVATVATMPSSMSHGYFAHSREIEEVSANNSMRCQVCGRQFKYKSCLITHIETKHPQGQFLPAPHKLSAAARMPALQCDFCGEMFVYHANLMKHKYKMHRELMHNYTGPVKQLPISQAISPMTGPSHLPSPIDIKPGVEPYPSAALSAFTPTLPARQITGEMMPSSHGSGDSPGEVRREVEGMSMSEGGDTEEEQAIIEGLPFQKVPRNSYECPVCKMTFVYGASFMKHMARYHPGEEVPYMGPVSRENYQKQLAATSVDVKTEPHMDRDRHRDDHCPDLMTIFETASLRIAGIKQEGLKNLSGEFSFNFNPEDSDVEDRHKGEHTVSSNGEVSSQEMDTPGDRESGGGDSDNAEEERVKKERHSPQTVTPTDPQSSGDLQSRQHASVIVDATDSHLYDLQSQLPSLQQSNPLESPISPKQPDLQAQLESGRKYYMCPVCRMEFVYGASFIKHMRRFHPGIDFELPKTGKGRTPSLGKTEDVPVSSTPEWKLSGPMWVDYSPKPTSLGLSPPRSQSPSHAVTSTVSSQTPTATQQQTPTSSMGGDLYQAKRTRQCPCCSAVFVYVGSLIKHMQKCHPGSTWLSDSNELRNYLKQDKQEQPANSTHSHSVQVPIQTRKDIVSRRGQRAHYCRICSKPFFYIASLHKHLLDHGVTPDEVVRLSSLTNPKEDSSGSVPASVLSGMPVPHHSQSGGEMSAHQSTNSPSNSSGLEPLAKRARIVTGEDFIPMQGGMVMPPLDDAPHHRMSLRSRANRLPVNYAEVEMEEAEALAVEEERQRQAEVADNTGVPYVTYHQAQHTVMSCMQQAYNALVALEAIQSLTRFHQQEAPLSSVVGLFEGDSQNASVLKSVTSSVATALQSAGHLGVALSDLQSTLNQRVEELNQKMMSAVHTETVKVGESSLVVEAPAGEVGGQMLGEKAIVEDERRLGIPPIEKEMEDERRLGIPPIEKEMEEEAVLFGMAKDESGPSTPTSQTIHSPDAKSTSSMDTTDTSPEKSDEDDNEGSKRSPKARRRRRKGTHPVAMTTTGADRDIEGTCEYT